ncbi:GerMN domain-containing protein [Alkalibacterium sp. m-11]|uniref:GerMN domain-containing protein n=1 Tax=Alkalibacterium indicireducens TaxID=398758 RepID=A0ABN1BCR2_9LACT
MLTNTWLKYTYLTLSAGLILAGCNNEDDSEDIDEPDEEVIAPEQDDEDLDEDDTDDLTEDDYAVSQDLEVWFPKLEDTWLEYEGEGIEYASFTRYPQFAHDDTLQMIESTAGTDVVTVYEYTEDEIREIFVRPETYFRDDMMDTGLSSAQDDHEIILQLPIEAGHSWESPTGSVTEITDVAVEIDLPFGTFDAIELTREREGNTTVYYYADGIGLVERISNPGDDEMEIRSTLTELAENQPEEHSVTVFTLDDQATELQAVNTSIELYTNEPIRVALTEVLRGQAEGYDSLALIAGSAEINYMYLGDDGIAYADFSVELIDDMNAGSGIESLIVQALVNTIGAYYNVEEVSLTVDDEPYSSGHLHREEGETWTVDHSQVSW